MTNLRCTAKLLRRLRLPSKLPDPPPGTNRLGDWYADILYLRSAHLVLCVSERGRLPIVATARRLDEFPGEMPRYVRDVLVALQVPPKWAEEEAMQVGSLAFGPTRNRSVVGSMNDFARTLRLSWDARPDLSTFEWSLLLAETPCGPLGMRRPRDVVEELFGPAQGLPGLQRASRPAEGEPPAPALQARRPYPSLSEFEHIRIDRLFAALRDRRIPSRLRGTLNLVWVYQGATVTLIDQRPQLMIPDEWGERKVAKFRRDEDGLWSLYCPARDGRWLRYRQAPRSLDVEDLLRVVEGNPGGVFWG